MEVPTLEPWAIGAPELRFNLAVGLLPDGHSASEQSLPLRGQAEPAATSIRGIGGNPDKTAPLQWFQDSGECGAIHGQEICDRRHSRRLRAIERHNEGKLAVGQCDGAQRLIEAASQGAGRPLHMKTEAAVVHVQRGFERNGAGP